MQIDLSRGFLYQGRVLKVQSKFRMVKDYEQEVWKPLPEKMNLTRYLISSLGRVKVAETNQLMKINQLANCYDNITLHFDKTHEKKKQTFYVHRLVALAFIPNPNNYATVDHIDRNRRNNNVTNLRWASYSHQGVNKKHRVTIYNHQSRKHRQIEITTPSGSTYTLTNISQVASHFNMSVTSAYKCLNNNKQWNGHIIRYKSIENLEDEEWKMFDMKITNVPYYISNYGRVKMQKSKSNEILLYGTNNNEYVQISIDKDVYLLHRVVAMMFCKNDDPKTKLVVNHKDGKKNNNNASNLEWVSHSDNMKHMYTIHNHLYQKIAKTDVEGNIIEIYNSIAEAKRKTGLTSLYHAVGKRNIKAGGFFWKKLT